MVEIYIHYIRNSTVLEYTAYTASVFDTCRIRPYAALKTDTRAVTYYGSEVLVLFVMGGLA